MEAETGTLRPRPPAKSSSSSANSTGSSDRASKRYKEYATVQSFFDKSRAKLVRQTPRGHAFRSRVISKGCLNPIQPPGKPRGLCTDPLKAKRKKFGNSDPKIYAWAGREKRDFKDPSARFMISQNQFIDMWTTRWDSKEYKVAYNKVKDKMKTLQLHYKLKDTVLQKIKKDKEKAAKAGKGKTKAEEKIKIKPETPSAPSEHRSPKKVMQNIATFVKDRKRKHDQLEAKEQNTKSSIQNIPMYVNEHKRNHDQIESNHPSDSSDSAHGDRRKRTKLSDFLTTFTYQNKAAVGHMQGDTEALKWLDSNVCHGDYEPGIDHAEVSQKHMQENLLALKSSAIHGSDSGYGESVGGNVSGQKDNRIDNFWKREYRRFFPEKYFANKAPVYARAGLNRGYQAQIR